MNLFLLLSLFYNTFLTIIRSVEPGKDCNKKVTIDSIYRMMDKLSEKEENILKINFDSTLKLFPEKIDVIFFDVTTLYYESTEQDEELKSFGFSKDCKFNQVQVVLALATTSEGLPIGYKLFRGNTAETKTLLLCLEEWKKQIPIENVIFIADRAMFSKDNIYVLEQAGHKYIIACKLRSLSEKKQNEIFNGNGYKLFSHGSSFSWKKEIDYDIEYIVKDEHNKNYKIKIKTRLITTYNSSRAKKDEQDRKNKKISF